MCSAFIVLVSFDIISSQHVTLSICSTQCFALRYRNFICIYSSGMYFYRFIEDNHKKNNNFRILKDDIKDIRIHKSFLYTCTYVLPSFQVCMHHDEMHRLLFSPFLSQHHQRDRTGIIFFDFLSVATSLLHPLSLLPFTCGADEARR